MHCAAILRLRGAWLRQHSNPPVLGPMLLFVLASRRGASGAAAQRELHDLFDRRAQYVATAYKAATDMFKSLDDFMAANKRK